MVKLFGRHEGMGTNARFLGNLRTSAASQWVQEHSCSVKARTSQKQVIVLLQTYPNVSMSQKTDLNFKNNQQS